METSTMIGIVVAAVGLTLFVVGWEVGSFRMRRIAVDYELAEYYIDADMAKAWRFKCKRCEENTP